MNTNQFSWQQDLVAGHDQNSNPITVRQLIEAINGYESLCTIASMSDSMRDNLARAATENYRVKLHNENLQRTINQLEQQLNSANARISQLLNEHADIDNSKALAILAQYADPAYWRNPYNQHGELDTQQRNVFAKGYHGYELAMSVIKTTQQVA